MSGGFYLPGCLANGATLTAIGSTTLTGGGTANTKGSWTQLTSSLPFDAAWVYVSPLPGFNGGANNTSSIDIGVGGAGSEKIIIADLVVNANGSSAPTYFEGGGLLLPISIKAGTRVAARTQNTTASGACTLSLTVYDADFQSSMAASAVDAIGFNSGTTFGTLLTNPGATNTKSAYTQLVASTTADYSAFFLIPDRHGAAIPNDFILQIDIAVGGAGSEKIIINDVLLQGANNSTLNYTPGISPLFPVRVPSGSRLAARFSASNTITSDLGLTLYGLRQ